MQCRFCGKEFKNVAAVNAHIGHKHKEEFLDEPFYFKKTGEKLNITNRELKELRQNHDGRCDIYGQFEHINSRPEYKNTPNALSVDHDHNTGEFRGFLCFQCNRDMGWFDKYREQIIAYVDKVKK